MGIVDNVAAMMPIRHWTDSKIRCHIFTCAAALALLRIIEIRLGRAGLSTNAQSALRQMLHDRQSQISEIPADTLAELGCRHG